MHIDLIDLRLFVAVAEAGSITGGATRAGLSLASASERIQRLQAQAGVRLLDRGRRGVTPTPTGTALLHHARATMQGIEAMRADLSAFAGGRKGRVRLVANTAAMLDLLPEALAGFLAAHNAIDVDVEEASSLDVVRAVSLDRAEIGIAADHADTSGLEIHPFHDDRLMLAMPPDHPLCANPEIAFAEALRFDFVGLSGQSALQRHMADHAERAGAGMRVRARVASLDLVCRMVAAGAGLAVVPEVAALRCRLDPSPVFAPLTDAFATRTLSLVVRRRQALSLHAALLFDHLLAASRVSPLFRRSTSRQAPAC